jgi:hypothetical protein
MFAKLIRAAVAVTTTCLITRGGNARAEILVTTAVISRGELCANGALHRPEVVVKVGDRRNSRLD